MAVRFSLLVVVGSVDALLVVAGSVDARRGLPAWVCIADGPLHRLAHSTGSPDSAAVMTPDELLDRLRSE